MNHRSSALPEGSRVVVTGGAGFLGRVVVDRLRAGGNVDVLVPRSIDVDLRKEGQAVAYIEEVRPTHIVHLAARVGGIEANRRSPGTFFRDNILMGVHVLEAARRVGVGKVLIAGTVCAYPKHTPPPFREEDLWNGYPEETNAPYGIAKKALLVMAQSYRLEFGMNAVMVLPVNLYGPNDNFDLTTSHVIPAMVRKFVEAEAKGVDVVLWGDGSPTREFLYVDDAAAGVLQALDHYDDPEPVNLGSGNEISIAALAQRIAALTGFQGAIRWDGSKPNGQPRRLLDTSRARERFGFSAQTTLDAGLQQTIAWYRAHAHEAP